MSLETARAKKLNCKKKENAKERLGTNATLKNKAIVDKNNCPNVSEKNEGAL